MTEAQLAAISAPDTCVWVDGPAGAGKTTVLVQRVAHLVEKLHAAPDRICVLTFTRAAAAVLEARLEALGIRGCVVGTLHAIAMKITSSYPDLVDRAEGFRIADDEDVGAARELAAWTLRRRTKGLSPKDRAAADALAVDWLKRANVAPYEMVMDGARRATAEMWAPSWLLVDEVQDLDATQWAFVEQCRAAGARVFAVGSQAQSIYGFRGALPERAPAWADEVGALRVNLDTNHRCVRAVVEVAARAGEMLGAGYNEVAARPDVGSAVLLRVEDRDGEKSWGAVVQTVRGWLAQGGKFEDIAILSPMWWPLSRLSVVLDDEEIPWCLDAAEPTGHAERILRLWVRLLAAPTNDILAFRLLQFMCSDWGGRLEMFMPFGTRPLLVDAGDRGLLPRGRSLPDLLPFLVRRIAREDVPHAEDLVREVEAMTHRERMRWAEDPATPTPGTIRGGVRLSSVHGAKGDEWPCVIYLRHSARDLHLDYVAFTRARDELTVISRDEVPEPLARRYRLNPGWINA